MKLSDIREGMRLRQTGFPDVVCTVIADGAFAFAVRYDTPDGEDFRRNYAYDSDAAEAFEPVPAPSPEPCLVPAPRATWRRLAAVQRRELAAKGNALDLASHPAVVNHGQGVSSDDLASFSEALASLAQSRMKGTGHEQYGQGPLQKFEETSPAELAQSLLEEAADIHNYVAMLSIKALALANAISEAA